MRRSPIGLVFLIVASCGAIQSSQVADQINWVVGLSKEHVLSCMGPPSSTAQVGTTEVWAYNSLGPIDSSTVVSGNQSLVVGSTASPGCHHRRPPEASQAHPSRDGGHRRAVPEPPPPCPAAPARACRKSCA